MGRQAQWEAYRLMAELGREIEKVRPALSKSNGNSAKWVQAYSTEDGWFRVDEKVASGKYCADMGAPTHDRK